MSNLNLINSELPQTLGVHTEVFVYYPDLFLIFAEVQFITNDASARYMQEITSNIAYLQL
jgi:hypothetical protein